MRVLCLFSVLENWNIVLYCTENGLIEDKIPQSDGSFTSSEVTINISTNKKWASSLYVYALVLILKRAILMYVEDPEPKNQNPNFNPQNEVPIFRLYTLSNPAIFLKYLDDAHYTSIIRRWSTLLSQQSHIAGLTKHLAKAIKIYIGTVNFARATKCLRCDTKLHC